MDPLSRLPALRRDPRFQPIPRGGWWRLPAVLWMGLVAIRGGFLPLSAQPTPGYAGRPFVTIAAANVNIPGVGILSSFGRAQMVGDSVWFAPLSGVQTVGVFKGRGGPVVRVAGPGSAAPSGGTLGVFHNGFARDTTSVDEAVIAAGGSRADALHLLGGTSPRTLLPGGVVLPNSGGLPATLFGEPFLASGALAVIAAHQPASGGETFRGVYRVAGGTLQAVADTASPLSDGFGIPSGFSSQVGFDGSTLAFWATRRPSAESEGMFVQRADRPVATVAKTGDSLPGGGTVKGFYSPPFVAGGDVYFFARDNASKTRLLRWREGSLTVLLADGDLTPDGDLVQSLGQSGLVVEGGRVYVSAFTPRGPGMYASDGVRWSTVVAPGTLLGGLVPSAIVVQDVAGDTVVLDVAQGSNRRLVANLAAPALPVMVSAPTDISVPAGAPLQLRVAALGDGPLSWQWTGPNGLGTLSTTDTLSVPAAAAVHSGYYTLSLTNPAGAAPGVSFRVNVEIAPLISKQPADISVEVGDQLLLRPEVLGGYPWGSTWYRDGLPVPGGHPAPEIFLRPEASMADAATYQVVMSNAWGTATSSVARVTVKPAAPNPVVSGGRLESFAATGMVPPGSISGDFAVDPVSAARRVGDSLVFHAVGAGGATLGLFASRTGAVVRLLAPEAPLPNGGGVAQGWDILPARAQEPLIVRARQATGQSTGLYRVGAGGAVSVLVDLKTPITGISGALSPVGSFGFAAQGGEQVLFTALAGGKPGLFLAGPAGVFASVPPGRNLPVVGTGALQFLNPWFDGSRFGAIASSAGLQSYVAFQLEDPQATNGPVTSLLETGVPIPGLTTTVRGIHQVAGSDGVLFFRVTDSANASHILVRTAAGLARALGAGMTLTDGRAVISVPVGPMLSSRGRVLLGGIAVRSGNIASQTALLVYPDRIEGLFPHPAKLDARRLNSLECIGFEDDSVILRVGYLDGGRALFSNTGSADGGGSVAPVVSFRRTDAGGLRIVVPAGTVLEASSGLLGPWQPQVASGEVEVRPSADENVRLFRLRKP